MLIAVNWAIFGPATILVCLRLITRIWITHNFGWDDAVIGLTQVGISTRIYFYRSVIKENRGEHFGKMLADGRLLS